MHYISLEDCPMAEQRYDESPRRDEETTNPKNPPNSVTHKGARRAAVWSYFVPIVVLFVVIGVGLLYWSNRSARSDGNEIKRSEVGTVGSTEGGFDPHPPPDNARDEIKFRGGDLTPITSVSELHTLNAETMAGRRVRMDDATVDSASGNTFWVRDDDRKYAVITSQGAPAVKPGAKVAVSGTIEPDSNGAPRVIADRVQVK